MTELTGDQLLYRGRQIRPGDMVSHRTKPDLDSREVVAVGLDWIILDFGSGAEASLLNMTRLPSDNYVIDVPAEGAL